MIASKKKLYFILALMVFFLSILVFSQISTAFKISVSPSEKNLIDTNMTDIPVDQNDPLFGNQGAAITIIEFVDLNSKDSREAHRQIKNFVANYPTTVRLIWKDLPVPNMFNNNAPLPHQAAWCVYKQDKNKFWAFTDALFDKKSIGDMETLKNLATELKLNTFLWEQCLGSTETKVKVETSLSLANSLGIFSAPAIFINNKKINYLDEINMEDFLKEIIKE